MIFKIENLNMVYDMEKEAQTYALKNINLNIENNKMLGIMGPSGSGKSSLLYAMAALKQATSGKILYGNKDFTNMSKDKLAELRKTEFGFVFQRHFLIDYMTAMENILTPINSNKEEHKEKAMVLLQKLGIEDLAYKKPSKLSGGQRQKIAIARALINDPKVIFGDELTAALDHSSAENVMNILNEYKKSCSIIIVTHDKTILSNADAIVNIWDGEINNIEKREKVS
jgi:putative ABC transport system ATP-binding protein